MKKVFGLALVIAVLCLPGPTFAGVTPNDVYQQRQADFENSLSAISDLRTRQKVEQASQMLVDLNQKICAGFDLDIYKMAAILEEEKSRQRINKTVVAYGQGSTPLDNAEYYLNYAEEAIAYQKVQDYTPQIMGGNLTSALTYSLSNLTADLKAVQGKVLKAKSEISLALDYYEK